MEREGEGESEGQRTGIGTPCACVAQEIPLVDVLRRLL